MITRLLTLVLAGALSWAQSSGAGHSIEDAARALESGNAAEAQAVLTDLLKEHPQDVQALMLMGVALDSQQRYPEAGPYYDRALKLAPSSAAVLNNAANHWLATGDRERARKLFLRVLAVDAAHGNAALQLAQMSVEAKEGEKALGYLKRLPADVENEPATMLLRIQALALANRCEETGALRQRLAPDAAQDAPSRFSLGMALAACGGYAEAERLFAQALDAEPGNFEILYNLGLAALRAKDTERAVDVLTRAVTERGDDADALFALAQARAERQELIEATAVLVRARAVAPRRADVALLLAQVSARLGFYQDAAAAYGEYLKLKPNDDAARRERGFAYARAGDAPRALPDLEWYTGRHPRDAMGWYELATAQALRDPAVAVRSLDRALAVDPRLPDAHFARAVLHLKDEHADRALEDLQVVLQREPDNYHVLTRLGQAYVDLNRVGDALAVLRKAVDLAPDDAGALLQYGRALAKAGQAREAAAIRARLKQAADRGPRPDAGLVEYLSLTPAQQHERYVANLRRNLSGNAANAEARMRLADALLTDGKTDEALALLKEGCPAGADAGLRARCGRVLMNHQQYQAALEFLPAGATLDRALAVFHIRGAEAAMAELDRTAAQDRKGDYWLLKAELLDAQGKVEEVAGALNQAIRLAPTRASLYLEATGFLLKRALYRQALDLLQAAAKLLPDSRELLLAQAITLELLNRRDDVARLVARMQARWPEWDRPWLLKGILLEAQYQSAEARQALETAIALGANTPEAYYYLALAITHSAPDDAGAAQQAIERAMKLTGGDPYVYLLAGRIALSRGDYRTALERLRDAVRLSPRLIAAHDAMRRAYSGMGDDARAAEEAAKMKELTEPQGAVEEAGPRARNLLFSVHSAE